MTGKACSQVKQTRRRIATTAALLSITISCAGLMAAPQSFAQPAQDTTTWSSDYGRWIPPKGYVFNSGWKMSEQGATYKACQTVKWHFLRSGEPADRSLMIQDVQAALALLNGWTGLKFEETPNSKGANLTFSWDDSETLSHGSMAGVGGSISGLYYGYVSFSKTNYWPSDDWAGIGLAQIRDVNGDLGPQVPKRQTLVIHEVMHAMGYEHTDDPTSIMYPEARADGGGVPNTSDIVGLTTAYRDNKCPTPVPTAVATQTPEGLAYVQARMLKRNTKVVSLSLTDSGKFSAKLKSRVPDGKRTKIIVTAEDENGKWVDTESSSQRVRGGIIRFTSQVSLHDYIYVYDDKNRFLARFTTDDRRRP